jgi:hypothetical protein
LADQIGVDCSKWPHESTCSVQMTGDKDDVLEAAAQHRAAVHQDDANTKTQINSALNDPAQPFAWRIL